MRAIRESLVSVLHSFTVCNARNPWINCVHLPFVHRVHCVQSVDHLRPSYVRLPCAMRAIRGSVASVFRSCTVCNPCNPWTTCVRLLPVHIARCVQSVNHWGPSSVRLLNVRSTYPPCWMLLDEVHASTSAWKQPSSPRHFIFVYRGHSNVVALINNKQEHRCCMQCNPLCGWRQRDVHFGFTLYGTGGLANNWIRSFSI